MITLDKLKLCCTLLHSFYPGARVQFIIRLLLSINILDDLIEYLGTLLEEGLKTKLSSLSCPCQSGADLGGGGGGNIETS